MTPTQLRDRALSWLAITAEEGPDFDAAELVAPAVAEWVDSLPGVDVTVTEDGTEWDKRADLGAVMLTARLIRRRNSPGGIEAFTGEGAAVYVRREDPDVARLLRLNYPQVG